MVVKLPNAKGSLPSGRLILHYHYIINTSFKRNAHLSPKAGPQVTYRQGLPILFYLLIHSFKFIVCTFFLLRGAQGGSLQEKDIQYNLQYTINLKCN